MFARARSSAKSDSGSRIEMEDRGHETRRRFTGLWIPERPLRGAAWAFLAGNLVGVALMAVAVARIFRTGVPRDARTFRPVETDEVQQRWPEASLSL